MCVPGNQQQEIILIVDDDLQLQQLLTRYLTEQGYATSAVGDGDAMDRWLGQHHPDLIILDLMSAEHQVLVAHRQAAEFDLQRTVKKAPFDVRITRVNIG